MATMADALPTHVVILAAGKGTRMRSRLPKVLQRLGGRPLLGSVLERARALQPTLITVVVGHQAAAVAAAYPDPDLRYVEQAEQLGTGHAVHLALEGQNPDMRVLVLYGDVPLIPRVDLERCLRRTAALTVLGAEAVDPTGYGRLVLNERGELRRIVEERDAGQEIRALRQINTGIISANARDLQHWLAAGEALAKHRGSEWYLTDVVAAAVHKKRSVGLVFSSQPEAVLGINDPVQLATQERLFQRNQAETCLRAGLQLADPARFDLRGQLRFGQDCFIDINVVLEGNIELGDGVQIGPGCRLRDVTIADDVVIDAFSVLESCHIDSEARIGPFARIRPGSHVESGAHVGNFVELKNTVLEAGAKANHLSYLGDARIGARSNIGAGTITCNYDGVAKHRTEIGPDAFIGSNTALVAPVRVGEHATIGAGSVVTHDAPANALTLARARQLSLPDWPGPKRS